MKEDDLKEAANEEKYKRKRKKKKQIKARGSRKWGRRTLKLRENQGGGALRHEYIKEEEIAEMREEDLKGVSRDLKAKDCQMKKKNIKT